MKIIMAIVPDIVFTSLYHRLFFENLKCQRVSYELDGFLHHNWLHIFNLLLEIDLVLCNLFLQVLLNLTIVNKIHILAVHRGDLATHKAMLAHFLHVTCHSLFQTRRG